MQVPAQPTRGGTRAEAPVSAPPVVPAPALPSWPPSTTGAPSSAGTGPGGYRPTTTVVGGTPTSDTPGVTSAGGLAGQVSADVRGGRYDGGSDLAGTVYGGGDGPGFSTVTLPASAVENSGSLTGHILAQGWADTPAERSSTGRVVIVLVAALALLVTVSVLVVLLANDALDGLVGSVLSG
ncbi:hypothetical protein GCM10027614_45270 [Micromonospora vulcania]